MKKLIPTYLYQSGAVKRYHTKRMIQTQTVADHSWGVAFILTQVCLPSVNLLMAALFHDMAEAVTGDIPATAKWDSDKLKSNLEALELDFDLSNGLHIQLNETESALLKFADSLELMLHCRSEIVMGNNACYEMFCVVRNRMSAAGFPTEAAEAFFKEVSSGS